MSGIPGRTHLSARSRSKIAVPIRTSPVERTRRGAVPILEQRRGPIGDGNLNRLVGCRPVGDPLGLAQRLELRFFLGDARPASEELIVLIQDPHSGFNVAGGPSKAMTLLE